MHADAPETRRRTRSPTSCAVAAADSGAAPTSGHRAVPHRGNWATSMHPPAERHHAGETWRFGSARLGADDPNDPDNDVADLRTRRRRKRSIGGGRSARRASRAGAAIGCTFGSDTGVQRRLEGRPRRSRHELLVSGSSAASTPVGCRATTNDGTGAPDRLDRSSGRARHVEDTDRPALDVGGPLLAARAGGSQSDTVTFDASDSTGIRAARLDIGGHVITPRRSAPATTPGRSLRSGAGQRSQPLSARLPTAPTSRASWPRTRPGTSGPCSATIRIDGTPPTAILKRARGKKIVLSVNDPASGVASTSVAVRNHSTDPYRTLQSTFANGTLRATLDRGVASRVDIRVTVADNAGNVSAGQPDAALRDQRQGRPALAQGPLAAACEIPFGRKAKLRGRLSLSAGGSLAGQTVVATSTVRKKGSRPVAAGSGDHRPARPLLDQRPGRPEPQLPPCVRRRPRGARDRARALGPRAGFEHDQGLTHAAVRPAASASPAACAAAACPCRAVSSSSSRAARAGSGARSRTRARTEGPLARLLPLQRTARELSDPRPDPPAGRLPVRARLLAPADDPGGLRGANSARTRPIAPDGSRSRRDRARPAAAQPRSRRALERQRTTSTRARFPTGRLCPTEGWTCRAHRQGGVQRSRTPACRRPSSSPTGALRGEISQRKRSPRSTWPGSSRRRRYTTISNFTLYRRRTHGRQRRVGSRLLGQLRPARSAGRRSLRRVLLALRLVHRAVVSAGSGRSILRTELAVSDFKCSSIVAQLGVRFERGIGVPARRPTTAGFEIYSARIGLSDFYPPTFTRPPIGSLLSTTDPARGREDHLFSSADDAAAASRRSGSSFDGVVRAQRQPFDPACADAVGDRSSPLVPCPHARPRHIRLRHRARSRTARTPSRRRSSTPPGTRLSRIP